MSFLKIVSTYGFVLVCALGSTALQAGAAQSTGNDRRGVVMPPAIKAAAPLPPAAVPVFSVAEHFSLECWQAFNEQLQTSLLAEVLDSERKVVLASVAPGACLGCEDKTWERVQKCRIFLETSKDADFGVNPSAKTREVFAVTRAVDVKKILLVARSQEQDLAAKASSSGGFDLNAQGWIVVVVNDAPHLPSSFPGLRNSIVVPSIKTLENGAAQVAVTIDGVCFPSTLFTMKEGSVARCGAVLVAKLLAAQVVSASLLFKLPEAAEPPAAA